MKSIGRCIFISRDLEGLSHSKQAKAALQGGLKHIQFRTKHLQYEQAVQEAKKIRTLCTDYGAFFTVNDEPHVAMECAADAVHLGLDDLPVSDARILVGSEMHIGGTCNTVADVVDRVRSGVNYVGLGPYQFTQTKQKLSPVLGLNGYVSILSTLKTLHIEIPIFAIGGIHFTDITSLLQTGVQGIALSSALGNTPDDIVQNAKRLAQLLDTYEH